GSAPRRPMTPAPGRATPASRRAGTRSARSSKTSYRTPRPRLAQSASGALSSARGDHPMRAAMFQGVGRPLAVERVPDLDPGPAEMIVAVRHCGICGSDLHLTEIADRSGGMAPLPAGAILGHEFAGEIVAVGRETHDRFRIGDRVTALPYLACGS